MANQQQPEDPHTLIGSIAKSALAAVPVVGGSLATAWSEWDSNRRFSRIECVMSDITSQLTSLSNRFDPNTIGDEELQLLEEVLRRVQREHREQKRRQFAHLLVQSWSTATDRSFGERLQHIRALEEFDETHIRLLAFLVVQSDKGHFSCYVELSEALEIPKKERDTVLIPILNTLATSYGFIKRAWGLSGRESSLLVSNNLSTEGIARGCEHAITDAGRRFLDAVTVERQENEHD